MLPILIMYLAVSPGLQKVSFMKILDLYVCLLCQNDFEGLVPGGIVPVAVGGDHSISLPILRALAPKYSASGPLGMVHIDAHCDTGGAYPLPLIETATPLD